MKRRVPRELSQHSIYLPAMNPKETVRQGYDGLSFLYRKDDAQPMQYQEWIARLLKVLPPPPLAAKILDIGCGCGVPISRDLVQKGHGVTGVDISKVQIERAKNLVPKGWFFQADIASDEQLADAIPSSDYFDAIVALYVLFHVPLNEQEMLMKRMASWMKEGGHCIMTVGIQPWTGEERGWLGSGEDTNMWWSQSGVEQYRKWATEAGFEIVEDEHAIDLVGGSDGHQFLMLRKRGSGATV
ncbi:S-adenosyl-L-methionine-dependent methyltransferase [Hygrophoropsis aurantiaca]|uniref:S-adenosyl-L-methionine-dependent methyltransferase n=1 Tax=Hygrophoropsis aurantiaca TaxID=72124 RepID=A0ACB8A9R2_9AGAM|nr:S-adenosyl-L-methionine-dependent methyltransferase [Hygrophoropsis aurantiaca]